MKTYFKYLILITVGVLSFSFSNDFLDEEPLDFYTPGNSLQDPAQFQSSINNLHNRLRRIMFGGINLDAFFALRYATDFAVNATDYNPPVKLNDYKNTMVPDFSVPRIIWEELYLIVFNANVVINRATISKGLTKEQADLYKSQALFFRAWAYNFLANLYGGVPLLLDEISAPKRDYTRATREEIYNQCKTDLLEAIPNLHDVNEVVDGALNSQAAQHLLTEVYINLKMYNEAITTASNIISHPALALMEDRFGIHKDRPGDVYRDLFELGNQNRSSGNLEGILVIQSDYLNPASTQRDAMQWAIIPNLGSLTVKTLVNGVEKSVSARLGYNDKLAGRGVGWMRPTSHFLYTLWQQSANDIRNSEYNIIRDFQIDGVGTNSPDFGKWYVKDGFKEKVTYFGDTIRNWFPVLKKATLSEGDFPDNVVRKDASGNALVSPLGGKLLLNSSQDLFRDQYLYRLAETYLLRAEAYILSNDIPNATRDINILRSRAKTTLADESEVNMDYLLDERLRELYVEECRMVTLTRMGRLYERTKRYNEKSGLSIEEYHNLWPIPYSEIERNVESVLTQNPGYK